MKIISWNINGIKSLIKSGHFDEIFKYEPDVLCLQEVKSSEIPDVEGYNKFLFSSQKTGSGVAVYTRFDDLKVKNGIGNDEFDIEGRFQQIEFENFILYNSYFPSGANKERLAYKFAYYDEVTSKLKNSSKPAIICGDFNRISKRIDAKRPEMIEGKSGFLPEEQEWFEDILKYYVDAFREFHSEGDKFTWWAYRANSRAKNHGYRFDYFLVSLKLKNMLNDSYILTDQMGSDHAPIVLDISYCKI